MKDKLGRFVKGNKPIAGFKKGHKFGNPKANFGRKFSEIWKKNISESEKGKKQTLDTIEKIKKARKNQKFANWKGGISKKIGYQQMINRRRRIRKIGNGGSHTEGEWQIVKAQYNWTCPC